MFMRFILFFSIVTILLVISFLIAFLSVDFERDETKIYFTSTPASDNKIILLIPAIDEKGNGVIAQLTVEAILGKGRTLVDVGNMEFTQDTQDSIKVAKAVGERIADVDSSKYDIIYSIKANASTIEGPSAGAALAVATVFALKNKTINNSIAITGYVDEEGNILKVSGVFAKAKISKASDIELLLVPRGQTIQQLAFEEKKCESVLFKKYCRIDTLVETVNISEEVGMRIEEVLNIRDAIKYFVVD